MAVFIRGGRVNMSSDSANAGVFIGQNVQNGWDSQTPQKVAADYSMGDFSDTPCYLSIYLGIKKDMQSTYDSDVKGNWNRTNMV